jgi:(p)ppGpp synthase/HD superfamily hydrolase
VSGVKLSARFGDAMSYALELHREQPRKGSGVPYLGHLLGTAAIVLHYGGDEEQAIAGLLHDAAEDQGGRATLANVEARFGARVARIVEGCTDTFESPKPEWLQRKQAYLARLRDERAEVLLVSAADKLDNARAIVMDLRALEGQGPAAQARFWDRFTPKRDGSLGYYLELSKTFAARPGGPLSRELGAAVDELHRLAGVAPGAARFPP